MKTKNSKTAAKATTSSLSASDRRRFVLALEGVPAKRRVAVWDVLQALQASSQAHDTRRFK